MAFKRSHKKRSFKKRSFKKRHVVKRAKKSLRTRPKNQFAQITETGNTPLEYTLGLLSANTNLCSVSLSDAAINNGTTTAYSAFTRIPLVAANFRFYRVTKVSWRYEAPYNVYGNTATTVSPQGTLPQFLWRMNRDADWNGSASKGIDLLEQGAKPIPFTRSKTIAYAPNVCLSTQQLSVGGAATAGELVTRKKGPWLSTESLLPASGPDPGYTWNHFGHEFTVYQDTAGAVSKLQLYCTMTVQFKQPLAAVAM